MFDKKVVAKKVLDWDTLGQFFKVLLDIFTMIRSEFVAADIGLKIIPWLTEEGRDAFKKALIFLSEKFWESQLIRITPDRNVIYVNLDLPPSLPFLYAEAVIDPNAPKKGWVKVERRGNDLCVGGKKIVLHLDERQKFGKAVYGLTLAGALVGKSVEHPNILDALLKHPHLLPDGFKQDEHGRVIYICFWGVQFFAGNSSSHARRHDCCVHIRRLYWKDGKWCTDYVWLGGGLSDKNLAAIREDRVTAEN